MKRHEQLIMVMGGPQAVATALGLRHRNVVQNWLGRGISYRALIDHADFWKRAEKKVQHQEINKWRYK